MKRFILCASLLLLGGCYCSPEEGDKTMMDVGYISECWNHLRNSPSSSIPSE